MRTIQNLQVSNLRKQVWILTILFSQEVRIIGAVLSYPPKHETGGATACVTAGRLAAADPTLKILVGLVS